MTTQNDNVIQPEPQTDLPLKIYYGGWTLSVTDAGATAVNETGELAEVGKVSSFEDALRLIKGKVDRNNGADALGKYLALRRGDDVQ